MGANTPIAFGISVIVAPLDKTRWALQQSVRRLLLSTGERGMARRAYRALRAFPPVRALWRLAAGEALGAWQDPEAYVRAGGVFEPTTETPTSAAPRFEDPAFYGVLLSRIRAMPREAGAGPVVLVNNGLSAGGAERQIVATLTGLKASGQDVRFIGEYLGRAPGLDFHLDALRAAGVPFSAPPQVTKPGNALYRYVSRPVADCLAQMPAHLMTEILDMAAALIALKPRVVHLWQDETSTKHAFAALIAGAPRIVLSGRNVNPSNFVFHQPYMRPAYRALANAPEIVFSNNSRAGAKSYADWLGIDAARIRVVYNGVETSRWPAYDAAARRVFRERLGLGTSPVVAGVMRLADEKRPLLWIEAAAALARLRPEARFVIAGDGPMRAETEALAAARGLKSAALFLGETRDVGLLLASSDAFFLASRDEGTPNALIEAQHYGVPSLTTRAGGAPEALIDGVTGLVARSDGAAALAAYLQRLLDDAALRDGARTKGPAFAAERFGLDRMIADTLALYKA